MNYSHVMSLLQTRALTDEEIRIALLIHIFTSEGDLFPSVSRLCECTGKSKEDIQRCLKKLSEIGYIKMMGNSKRAFSVHPSAVKEANLAYSVKLRYGDGEKVVRVVSDFHGFLKNYNRLFKEFGVEPPKANVAALRTFVRDCGGASSAAANITWVLKNIGQLRIGEVTLPAILKAIRENETRKPKLKELAQVRFKKLGDK